MGLFGKKEDPEDLMYQAMTFLEKNQPKAAVSLFKKVTKIDPENVNAWYIGPPKIEPERFDGDIVSVYRGASVNFNTITFNPILK